MGEHTEAETSCLEDNKYFSSLFDLVLPRMKQMTDYDEGSPSEDEAPTKKARLDPQFSAQPPQQQMEDEGDTTSYSKIKQKQKQRKKKTKKDESKYAPELQSAASNLEILQEKLQTRILELKAKRGKLTPDEMLESKRLKRKTSKLKLKMRRTAEKMNKNKAVKQGALNTSEKVMSSNVKVNNAQKAVFNKEGNMVFSKFDFSSQSSDSHKSHSGLTGKDYKRLLEKVEKRNEKVEKLKEKDADAAKKLQDKVLWQTAVMKAGGERVKDDPDLLKKSLKRKDKIKDKRQKKWQGRTKQEKNRMMAKQEKRQQNIDTRKQAKTDKKIKKAKKKGRIIPGF